MAPMLKIVAKFAAAGTIAPAAFWLVSLAVPVFPVWLLMIVVVLCPPYILFLATAACDPFGVCSLNMLAVVAALNATLYALVGGAVCVVASYFRRRSAGSAAGGAA